MVTDNTPRRLNNRRNGNHGNGNINNNYTTPQKFTFTPEPEAKSGWWSKVLSFSPFGKNE